MKRKKRSDLSGLMGAIKMGSAVPVIGSIGVGMSSQVSHVAKAPSTASSAVTGIAGTGVAGMAGMSIIGSVTKVAEREMKKQRRY